jgi:hypothetical protein
MLRTVDVDAVEIFVAHIRQFVEPGLEARMLGAGAVVVTILVNVKAVVVKQWFLVIHGAPFVLDAGLLMRNC